MDIVRYHFPPELYDLLVDTIPRLHKSRELQLTFYRGASVPNEMLADLAIKLARDRNSINRYEIAKVVLRRLNEKGELMLGPRRQVIQRVVEWDDFTRSWPGERIAAEGYVAKVQKLVNQKDSFIRMNEEREAERILRVTPERVKRDLVAMRQTEREAIKKEFYHLFTMDDQPHARGALLEKVLNRLFKHENIQVAESFKRRSATNGDVLEQIDGVIYLESHLYCVEMKWHAEKIGPTDVHQHLSRISYREARGIFITSSEFTQAAIEACRDAMTQRKVVTLLTVHDFVQLFESGSALAPVLLEKINGAILGRHPKGSIGNVDPSRPRT